MLECLVKHRASQLTEERVTIIVRIRTDRLFQLGQRMAGVKQFDRDEVLDHAMAAFWTRGYEGTSIDDLVQATGIGRGSLYGTFADKRQLFLAALDRYWNTVGMEMFAELSDPDPRHAIERMFDALIRRASNPKFPRGCLFTNTSLECPSCGDEIARKIAENMGQQETAIYQVLRKAQADGTLNPTQDARALARFFLGVAWGINAVNKSVADPGVFRDIVRVAMSVWDTAAAVQIDGPQMTERRRRGDPHGSARKKVAARRSVPQNSK
jgi:TetR/AcrR family transcriptional regulator, transcriptional repressor for nem operon